MHAYCMVNFSPQKRWTGVKACLLREYNMIKIESSKTHKHDAMVGILKQR